MEIIPGILEKEWSAIEEKLLKLKPFAKSVHVDLIDGKFADNSSFLDPEPFRKYKDDFTLELHLMVEDPLIYLKPWADAGFQRFIGHIEKMPDPVEFVAQGQLLGAVGLAIDGPTSLDDLQDLNLNDLDCLLIMTITAGEAGQKFMPEHLEKVREVRKNYEFLTIEVDGGINPDSLEQSKAAGANRFVCNSHLFGSDNIEEEFKRLTSRILM